MDHRVAQERTGPWTVHNALGSVHLQTKSTFQEPGQRRHDPQASSLAADTHVGIVRVAAQTMSWAFELLLGIIQQEFRQQRREPTDHDYTYFGDQYKSYIVDPSGFGLPLPGLPADFSTDLLARR